MNKSMSDAGTRQRFQTPKVALAVYAAYMALLFSFGQQYPLVPWLLMGAVVLGIPTLLIIGRALHASPGPRPWFSSATDEETGEGRPGLGLLLIVVLSGPAPFLLSAAVQQGLLGLGVTTVWLLAASAGAVFGLIFSGYWLIETMLNRKCGSAAALHSSAR